MRLLTTVMAGLLAFGLASPADSQPRENRLLKAKSWAFQLKNLEPDQQKKIAASPYDLVVIDSEQFPDEKEIPLTKEEVERMKIKPDGSKRLVIAYLSVGEAETYRYYWKPEWNKKRPDWVGKENKEWKENFNVKYWEPVWQNIVYGNPNAFADRIMAAGFDGFYIDRADAYYHYGDTKLARDRMSDFIIKLTNYMRKVRPDIQILVQNAEELLDRPDYVAAIDGIAKEDLLYGITHKEEPNKKTDVDWSSNLLKPFKAQNKAVFVIEYLTRPDYIADASKRLGDLGFVMYTGPRGLGSLVEPGDRGGPRRGQLDPSPASPSAAVPPVGVPKTSAAKPKAAATKSAQKVKAAAKLQKKN
jgi:cysteinyl-tRNA synthetase, unknown class